MTLGRLSTLRLISEMEVSKMRETIIVFTLFSLKLLALAASFVSFIVMFMLIGGIYAN